MPWLILAGVLALCCVGSAFSYIDRLRQWSGYVTLMVFVSLGTGYLFARGCKVLDDKGKIFVFGLGYDTAMVTAYYLLPLAVLGLRLNAATLGGAALVLLGFVFIKLGSPS